MSNIIFTPDLGQNKLQQLNVKKSPGLDKMHHPCIERSLIWTCCALVHILFTKKSYGYVQGILPHMERCLCHAHLKKKGDKTHPNDYSPLSLTSIVCKVMESIVRDNLMSHLTATALLSDNQHGFWPGRSCPTNLLTALDNWTRCLDEKKYMLTLFILTLQRHLP